MDSIHHPVTSKLRSEALLGRPALLYFIPRRTRRQFSPHMKSQLYVFILELQPLVLLRGPYHPEWVV